MSVELVFGEHAVALSSRESLGELLAHLTGCSNGSLMLGLDGERPVCFHAVTVDLNVGVSHDRRFGIGVCSSQIGLGPRLLLRPESETLLLGFNDTVAGISAREGKQLFSVRCEGPVYWIMPIAYPRGILVLCELGAVCIADPGTVVWRYAQDLLTAWRVEASRVFMQFADAPAVWVDIASGAAETA